MNENTILLTVNVSDVNDETPVVTAATENILETKLVGEQIYQVIANDADANSDLTYSITNGNTNTAFAINSSTGAITINTALDYETTTTYALEISVSDGTNTGTGTFTVNIVDVNDETPQVSVASISVSETTAVSTEIHTVVARDDDANSNLIYSIISGNIDNYFEIIQNTGIIRILKPLDYEDITTCYLNVSVSDGIQSATATITINISDENDETPVVTSETITIAETETIGYSPTTVKVSDADASSIFAYYITSGNTEGKFSINENTGKITLADNVNYEATNTYTLAIRVNDGINDATGEITINIQALNDEYPIVASEILNLSETAIVGQIVTEIEAFDPDGGSTLKYSISNGNDNNRFQIDPTYGIIKLLAPLDYETTESYSLEIIVDDGLFQTSATVSISILNENDETPELVSASTAIDEDLVVGLQVFQPLASDPDGTTSFTYFILSGNANNAFAINPTTGTITLNAALDFETIETYQLEIGVFDGVETGVGTISITLNDVNDETPVVNNAFKYISESALIDDELVTLIATDADVNSSLTYNIIGGNAEGKFAVNSLTGIISLANTLDYETTTEYILTLSVFDGIYTQTGTATISIIDANDEIPVISDASISVLESENIGYFLHTMQTTDADAGTDFSYSIHSGNDNNHFSINQSTGIVSLQKQLDFEIQENHLIKIVVSDGIHSVVGNLYINVLDADDSEPIVEGALFTVSESIPIATVIHTVVASDIDGVSQLVFSIFSGNEEGKFLISSSTGIISIANNLDYETKTSYNLQVKVSDGSNFTTGIVSILVSDENDEIPVFANTEIEVNEATEIGDFLEQLTATDADANSDLTFSIAHNGDNGIFNLDAYGELLLGDYLDFETQNTYSLEIEVSDGLNIGKGILTIKVADYDENTFVANNTFTPNNDGINDFWEVEDAHLYYKCKFLIFNSIGEIIYQSIGYNNDWDGTYKGKQVPVGTYYYITKCPDCADCNSNGSISIIR